LTSPVEGRVAQLDRKIRQEGWRSIIERALAAHRANFADLVLIAKAKGWPGYFGAPRLATAARGAQEFALSSQNVNSMALQILDGLDSRKIPRYADEMDPLDVVGENAELQHEQAVEKRELDWLKTNKIQ
jgi:hypothetical protein